MKGALVGAISVFIFITAMKVAGDEKAISTPSATMPSAEKIMGQWQGKQFDAKDGKKNLNIPPAGVTYSFKQDGGRVVVAATYRNTTTGRTVTGESMDFRMRGGEAVFNMKYSGGSVDGTIAEYTLVLMSCLS